MEREEEEGMLLVAENGEGEGKKEAEERKAEKMKREDTLFGCVYVKGFFKYFRKINYLTSSK